MSKLICTSAIDGAVEWVARADEAVARAVAEHGEGQVIGFPSTAYHLPIIYSLSEHKVETLGDGMTVWPMGAKGIIIGAQVGTDSCSHSLLSNVEV